MVEVVEQAKELVEVVAMVEEDDFGPIAHNANSIASLVTRYKPTTTVSEPNFQSPPPTPQQNFPFSNSYPPPLPTSFHQSRAYLTAPSVSQNSTRYENSGASHHVIVEHNNILQHSDSNQTPDLSIHGTSSTLFIPNPTHAPTTVAATSTHQEIPPSTQTSSTSAPLQTEAAPNQVPISGIESVLPMSETTIVATSAQPNSNVHHMTTRSKTGSLKPKTLNCN
ncbi:hypothetical protein PIB30_059619 [Stylosanthes scabra]|uniref:Uncharacterized protein n=1 Tax=Stylosanthes scabra TaxID=79078 RepID=A0ABU6RKG2_9FABA|nr:hypothetical protein [Stylosanthes scabra]